MKPVDLSRRHLLGIVFAAVLLLGATFAGGYALGDNRGQRTATEASGFALLWRVRDLLSDEFMGEAPPPQAQAYGAIHGLVGSYRDPYTVFIEPAPRKVERDELRGFFGGIGAYMRRDAAGDLTLITMRDRPAARAGVLDGDVLLAVDGAAITRAMTVEHVVALVRGDVGTKVSLTLRRPGQTDAFMVTIVRERIETPSVEWRVLDAASRIGYISIRLFGERTGQELKAGLADLAVQDVQMLVLDLRGNGGGLVDAAVETTSQFLREGTVLREVRRGGYERFYPVKSTASPAHDWEIVLLVDAGTASASEIVAGALRDQRGAVLVGEKTFGKGSVQEVHELPDGSSLHVTVARWLTSDRRQIDKAGLQPDIVVGITSADRDAGRDPQLARAVAWLQGQR